MPKLPKDQLERAIAIGDISAISIDTEVFIRKGKTFDHPVICSLTQFKDSDIDVVIADVVAREIEAHLREDAAKTQSDLKKALRDHNKRWRRENSENECANFLICADPIEFCEKELSGFKQNTGCEVLSLSNANGELERVFDLYFSQEPPFGTSKNKKSEFPDAFALLTLEAFAARNQKQLLCVSSDKGWLDFAEQSNHLVCVEELEDALTMFNAANQNLAEIFAGEWLTSNERIKFVKKVVEKHLDFLDIYIRADSDVPFNAEPSSADLRDLDIDTTIKPQVIEVNEKLITFFIKVEASVYFEATFDFYVRSRVEKNHIELVSQEEYVEMQVPYDLTITVDRPFNTGLDPRIVDVSTGPIDVDFGQVGPFRVEV